MSSYDIAESAVFAQVDIARQCKQTDRHGYEWSHPTLGVIRLTEEEHAQGILNQQQTAATGINLGGLKESAQIRYMNMQHDAWMTANDPRHHESTGAFGYWAFFGFLALILFVFSKIPVPAGAMQ